MGRLGLALLLCLAGASAQAASRSGMCNNDVEEQALHDARTEVRNCVRDAVLRLEPSGEPAQDIATAAVSSCGREVQATTAPLLKCLEVKMWFMHTNVDPDSFRDLLNDYRTGLRNAAVQGVVTIRSRRAQAPTAGPN